MAAEMAEQPGVLAGLIDRWDRLVEAVRSVRPEPLAGIVIIARGSSDHAGVYGRYALEIAAGRPVSLAAPSIHTLYRAEVLYRDHLAIAVSQSGRTPEIVTVLARLRAAGARAVAITNEASSPLAEAAEVVVDLRAGEERAVPATKTFTAQVAAFALLAEALGRVPWTRAELATLPEAVAAALSDTSHPEAVASDIGDRESLIAAGRGYLYSAALEAALKLKETTSIHAEGYSSADLRHGPIAVVGAGFPVVAFVAPGPTAADMTELVGTLRRRGARVYVVAAAQAADLPVPETPEPLMPIPAAVRSQQVAHALAVLRGLDPDEPPGLTKITPTV